MAKPRDDEKKSEENNNYNYDNNYEARQKPIKQLRVTAGGEVSLRNQEKQNWKDKQGCMPIKSKDTKPQVMDREKQMMMARIRELEGELLAMQEENRDLKERENSFLRTRESMRHLLFGEETKGYGLCLVFVCDN